MLLTVLLLLQEASDGDAYAKALGYLARHQDADGSWGRPPRDCRCADRPRAPAPAPEPAVALEIARRIRELGADEHAAREEAVRALVGIGSAAGPALREAEAGEDAEVRARAADALRRITRREQRPAVKPTAWAVIAFVQAGYSHLSKDEEEGVAYGPLVRRAAEWLLGRQKAEGTFAPGDEEADLSAALAMCELYSLTGSMLWKDGTEQAVRRVLRDASGAPRTLFLKSVVRRSAEFADVKADLPELYVRLRESLEGREDPLAQVGRALALAYENRGKEARVDGLLALDPAKTPFEDLCFARWAVGHSAAHRESVKAWRTRIIPVLVKAQRPGPADCHRGSWDAVATARRVETTAFLAGACDPCSCKTCNSPFFRK